MDEKPPEDNLEQPGDSLEPLEPPNPASPETTEPVGQTAGQAVSQTVGQTAAPADSRQHPRPGKRRLAIAALLLFVLAAIIGLVLTTRSGKKPPTTVIINTQSLDAGTLHRLEPAGGPGSVTEQLTITPNTLFKNDVEIQGNAKVDKNLTVGGNLTVNGTSTLQGAVSLGSSLNVHGGLTVGGNTTLGGDLSVSGTITAGSLSIGSLTVTTIHLSGDLNISGHLVPTGATPAIKPSVAANGGTATISGNDTAGTITINIGGGGTPPTGELAIITFHAAFGLTPKVQLTPINAASAALDYYATRSAPLFTVDTGSPPAAGASYVFDYLVTQ